MIVTADLIVMVTLFIRLGMFLVRSVAVPMRVRFAIVVVRVGVVQVLCPTMSAHKSRRAARHVRKNDA